MEKPFRWEKRVFEWNGRKYPQYSFFIRGRKNRIAIIDKTVLKGEPYEVIVNLREGGHGGYYAPIRFKTVTEAKRYVERYYKSKGMI